jgi:hypothetical protein
MDNFQNLLNLYQQLPEDADSKSISRTADILSNKHYSPILIYPVGSFITMKKKDMLKEYHKTVNGGHGNGDNEMLMYHLKLLLYHYQILCRLRNDEPEAWDIINELYEDD